MQDDEALLRGRPLAAVLAAHVPADPPGGGPALADAEGGAEAPPPPFAVEAAFAEATLACLASSASARQREVPPSPLTTPPAFAVCRCSALTADRSTPYGYAAFAFLAQCRPAAQAAGCLCVACEARLKRVARWGVAVMYRAQTRTMQTQKL